MKLLTIGTGEAFDDLGLGNTSFLLFGKSVPTVLFDCGYQIPERLWQHPKHCMKLDAVYLTHLHGDHTMGLPPLFIRFFEEGRKNKLTIFGPRGTQEHVTALAELAYSSIFHKITFPIEFVELCCDHEVVFKNIRLCSAHSSHSRENLSVRVWVSQTKSFAISGDGALTESTMHLFKGTDLLLHEVFSPKPAGLYHCDLEMLMDYLPVAGIKKIGVTHISRKHIKEIRSFVFAHRSKEYQLFIPKPGEVLGF
ncbi:MAG: beta-lactamase superfamily hydrolase [uncultured bacterium]|nr:MAG: beta-lactamase superfamily hydrolase [uncultured bacterium]